MILRFNFYDAWYDQGNKHTVKNLPNHLKVIDWTTFAGIGKPELLKYGLAGLWFRPISDKHRLIYRFEKATVLNDSVTDCYA